MGCLSAELQESALKEFCRNLKRNFFYADPPPKTRAVRISSLPDDHVTSCLVVLQNSRTGCHSNASELFWGDINEHTNPIGGIHKLIDLGRCYSGFA
jgi:hypothetical protein